MSLLLLKNLLLVPWYIPAPLSYSVFTITSALTFVISLRTIILLPASISIKEEDLLAILNNLLDNAIDACKKESDKKLFIQMITIKSFLKITIKNSCSENVFLQNPHLETKKSDRSYHGFGLKIVQKIAKSYHGTLRTEQIDDFFCNGPASICIIFNFTGRCRSFRKFTLICTVFPDDNSN